MEQFITELDDYVRANEMCVNPQHESFDCCDCTICREVFYSNVRKELTGYAYPNG